MRLLVDDMAATPHTRGSTVTTGMEPIVGVGYPAYAGIDLRQDLIDQLERRLPRIRGDRPVMIAAG